MAAIRLRRVRLDGIGPPGARFDPLTIDVTTGGAASPVALLFLENGGGKSVLLRLVFSVVLPGRRNVVGGAKLTDYVLARDVGHVICEWEVDDGRLLPSILVTGKVFEWQGGSRSANTENLKESWYSFQPSPGIADFDTLTTRDDGRRVSRAGFLAALGEAQRSVPALNLVVEHSPGAWRQHLFKNTPLDPELFRYQRAMNVDESDADELFAKVTTGEAFVRFLLRAAADHDELGAFGALLDAYATQASSRDALEVQRAFAESAVGALRALAEAEAVRQAAADRRAEADRRADLFARSLLAAVAVADHQAEASSAAAAGAKEQAEAAGSESNRFESFARELRRQAALFDLADAEALASDALEAVSRAETESAGWQSVPAVGMARRAAVRRRELAAAVARAAKEEAPYRRDRDRAAAALRAGVERDKVSLERQACAALGEAADLDRQADAARQAAIDAEARAARADAESEQLLARIAATEEERRRLVDAGVLGPAEPAATARDRHHQVAVVAGERLTAIAQRRAAILQRQATSRQHDGHIAERYVGAETDLRTVDRELEQFRLASREVLGAERVVALVGDATELWPAAERVRQILDDAIDTAEIRVRDLRFEVKDDEDALDSLGLEGRLPASADVQAALGALRAARVPATTCWSWLAQLDELGRERALARNPFLAGGIIVTNPGELDRAREVLADAGLDMRSIVAVGPAADLGVDAPAVQTFAVAPNPALYDERWADSERQRLAARVEVAQLERVELIASADADRRLRDRLADVVHRWPLEIVAGFEARAAERRADVESLRAERLGLAAELRQLDDELSDLEAEVGIRRAAEQRAAAGAGDTGRLGEHEADAAEARERIPLLAQQAAARREDAARQIRAEVIARRDASTKRAEAAEMRRHRTDLDPLLDRVPVVDLAVDPDGEAGSVDDLRARFDATVAALTAVALGDDLHAALEAAEASEAVASAAIDDLPVDVRNAAERFASGPAAATPASLDEAQRSAAAALDHARAEDKAAANLVALAEKEVEATSRRDHRAGRAHADLPDEWSPTDAGTARRLAEDAGELARGARSRQLAAESEQSHALAAAAAARTRGQVLKAHAGSLGRREADPAELVGVAPWSGSEESAADQANTLAQGLAVAHAALAEAQGDGHKALEAVRRVANEARFFELGGVRQAMASEAGESLAGRAGQLVRDVTVRLASVVAELAEVNRHREGVVERLSTLVEEQLKLVALARRFSRIPAGLGEWSDQQFCRIDFQTPDNLQLSARVGAVVDDVAARARRDPLEVVLDATVAAVARRSAHGDSTFEVRLLKPNKAMFVDTVDVSRMGEEYSGGQRLTTAILLYCTLAAVRSHARGDSRGAGVLFLDNPIGKASADYLLDLQTAVAAKFGVQLVYTTGLFDPEVHDAFDCVVRLRNDADLRRHLNYIVLDGPTADAVAEGRDPGDRNAYVSGVRLSLLES